MGYRIEYDGHTGALEIQKVQPWRLPTLTCICFLVFLMLCSMFWPEALDLLEELMIPGDNGITLSALDAMTHDLRAGATFEEAVSAFCLEIIRGAESRG